ncbi:MAG TPA: theronine dehydrogenase, partial [Streptosporangiaceae bacterium]
GIDVHVLDKVRTGPKPDLVKRLGGRYHHDTDALAVGYDLTLECSGTGALMVEALCRTAATGTACLVGIPSAGQPAEVDLGGLNRQLVLTNQLVIATMTANRRHFEEAIQSLTRADHDWLAAMITRRLALADWQDAFDSPEEQVKTVISLSEAG